jgi:3-oxoacyl-[acyl-carrier protein] reductase
VALFAYDLARLPGLARAGLPPASAALGWSCLFNRPVEALYLPGGHDSLPQPPHVQPLAAVLRDRLGLAEALSTGTLAGIKERERRMKLTEVKAVVTGAAGGLGGYFALELARAGARVAAGDTNAAGLRRLASEAEDLGGQLTIGKLDVTDEASVEAFCAAAAEQHGGLNVLVNSAGIIRDGTLISREGEQVTRLPLAQWRKVMDVNLTGPFLMTREAALHMVQAGVAEGVVVNLSSIARAGNPGQANYAASKAGLDACTRTWALELARYGIRVGGIAPGVTDTSFLEGISETALAKLTGEIPLGRLGRPEDIWRSVRYIIECEFFTGRVLEVDGGAIMGKM